MLKESEEGILTLDERMRLSMNKLQKTLGYIILIVISVFFFSGMALYETITIDTYLNNLEFEFPMVDDRDIFDHVTQIQYLTIVSIGIVFFALIWLVTNGRKIYGELGELQNQKIRQSYYLTFETTVLHGENSVEKLFNTLRNVFLEIKEAEGKKEKRGKEFKYVN